MSLFRHKKSRDKHPVTVFPYLFPGLRSLLRRPATSHEHFGHLATASRIAGTLPDAASAPESLLLSKLKLHFNHDIAQDALQPSGRPLQMSLHRVTHICTYQIQMRHIFRCSGNAIYVEVILDNTLLYNNITEIITKEYAIMNEIQCY